mgnify:FL=1
MAGFLGAGKTTAAAEFARFLQKRGKIAAVITNDHGAELVDSTTLRAQGIFTESLQGGALCGLQADFIKIAHRFIEKSRAEVLIAEPIGTCSNFARDFIEPLRRANPIFTFAPLSVLVDPLRARQLLKPEAASAGSNNAAAPFRHQLAEADFIVINKADQLPARDLAELRMELAQQFPSARIFTVSATGGAGLEEWFECVMSKDWVPRPAIQNERAMEEISISWLNCTVLLSSVRYFEAGKLLVDLATCVQSLLKQEAGEIIHLKMVLKPDHDGSDIAALSLVQSQSAPKLSRDVSEPIQRGELFLSARAEADPEILHSVLNRALLALMERSSELFARMQHCEHFRPGNSKRPSASAALA